MRKLPKLYWHCAIGRSDSQVNKWDAIITDYPLDRIESEIAIPWRKGIRIFFGGKSFSPDASDIQIIHTPSSSEQHIAQMTKNRFIQDAIFERDVLSGLMETLHKGRERLFKMPEATDYTNTFLVAEYERTSSPKLQARSQSHLRKILLSQKLTDSDFDAILMDIDSTVKARVSDGMDRQRKINILFEFVELEKVYAYLESMYGEYLSHSSTI